MNALQRQHEYLSIGVAFFLRGVDQDQVGNKTEALRLYNKGLEVLKDGLNQVLSPEDQVLSMEYREQMKRHVINVTDRVSTLEVLLREPPVNNKSLISNWQEMLGMKPSGKTTNTDDHQLRNLKHSLTSALNQPKPAKPNTPNIRRSVPQSPTGDQQRKHAQTVIRAPKPAPAHRTRTQSLERGNKRDSSSVADLVDDDVVKKLSRAGVEPRLLPTIASTMINPAELKITWDDVSGLASAKQALFEAAVLPMQRPDLFTGLRRPPKGILLYGPPGTGKTMLAKACASTTSATFFNVSSSSLTSRFVGEGEKLVKALFKSAWELQPSIIFIDEIDSLLTNRSDNEAEYSRRLKTEFMVQMEGLGTNSEGNVLVLGATNRPHELDDAVLRRFPKRIYIALPDQETRHQLFKNLLKSTECSLNSFDYQHLTRLTEGYSNSDITELCREAVMIPLRELGARASNISADKLRKVNRADFENALRIIRPSTNSSHLRVLENWSREFGSH